MNRIYTSIAMLGLIPPMSGILPTTELPSRLSSQPSQTMLVATKLKSCGTDWNCFIQAARTCTPAQVRGDTFANMFGMDYTVTGLYEIWGKKENKCAWFSRSDRVQIRLSDDFRNLAAAQGMTPQQIAEYERELTSEASQARSNTICHFNQSNDLATYLEIMTRRRSDRELGFRSALSLNSSSSSSVLTINGRDIAECNSTMIDSPQ